MVILKISYCMVTVKLYSSHVPELLQSYFLDTVEGYKSYKKRKKKKKKKNKDSMKE
jgi:hypothetical protein